MDDYVPITIEFESLLSNVFGKKSMHGLAGNYDLSTGKRIAIKLVNGIQKALDENVSSDPHHQLQIEQQIQAAHREVKSAKSSDQLLSALVTRFAHLVFLLMGDTPDNRRHSVVNHRSHWNLSRHRTVAISQTSEQKANLIYDEYRKGQSQYDLDDPVNTAHRDLCPRDPKGFVSWYRDTYPDAYRRLFCHLP